MVITSRHQCGYKLRSKDVDLAGCGKEISSLQFNANESIEFRQNLIAALDGQVIAFVIFIL